jgi:hypothetical protein
MPVEFLHVGVWPELFMNGVFEARTGMWSQRIVVHPGVRAGAKRGRRICFVAFTLQ